MVFSTAFERQRERRRGFGKQTDDAIDSPVIANAKDSLAAKAVMRELVVEEEEEESMERLWSDQDEEEDETNDYIPDRSSPQNLILACAMDQVEPKNEEDKDHFQHAEQPTNYDAARNDDHEPPATITAPDRPKATELEPKDNDTPAIASEECDNSGIAGDVVDQKVSIIKKTSTAIASAVETSNDSTTTTLAVEKSSKKAKKKKKSGKTGTSNPLLELDDILASTERWFAQVSDKMTVTVKDIVKSLCIEYDCAQLPKPMKKAVRNKLAELMAEELQDEEEQTLCDDEESAIEGDAESSGDDGSMNKRSEKPTTRRRRKDIPKPSKGSTKLAKKVHAQQQRKRQLEDERVKNEELNALQSKQDEAVADAIANALEIEQDTLPQRLALLSKLDEKRLGCLRDLKSPSPERKLPQSPVPSTPAVDLEDEYSSSDDDIELEIEGPVQSLGQNLLAPLRSPPRKVKSSPMQKNSRATLRARLLQQQRTMGNQWLARELGYKDEQEHLQDCRAAELEKRRKIQRLEEAKAAQRAQQRERLLKGASRNDDDDDEPLEETPKVLASASQGSEDMDVDDDEELLLANKLENDMATAATILESADSIEAKTFRSLDFQDATTVNAVTEPSNSSSETGTADIIHPQIQVVDSLPRDQNEISSLVADAVPEISCVSAHDAVVNSDLICPPQTLPLTDSLLLDSNPSSSIAKATEKSTSIKRDSIALDASNFVDLHDFADVNDEDDDDERPFETQQIDTVAAATDTVPAATDNGTKVSSPNNQQEVSTKTHVDPEAMAKRKREKNVAWKAILEKDKKAAKKKTQNSLVEDEADEEEEEEVAGLEDFGFIVKKKKDDDEVEHDGEYNEDDLENVVDELSDNEGDEDAGEKARKLSDLKEEKLRHKEIMRRMREGYDGRRGGIAGGGASRGHHRFDQLVAADNREDAKRLGLLNDDELDSDDEEKELDEKAKDDEEEDEAALLDKIIKDRFLHRSSIQENFDEDDDVEGADETIKDSNEAAGLTPEELEEMEQERLAKRFSKRARMTRLVETHGDSQEFSQSRLIDEDKSMLVELQSMKNGLVRKRSSTSQSSMSAVSSIAGSKKPRVSGHLTSSIIFTGGSLAMDLAKSRHTQFTRRHLSGGVTSIASIKSMSLSHVVFQGNSNSRSGMSSKADNNKVRQKLPATGSVRSFFERTVLLTASSKKRKA